MSEGIFLKTSMMDQMKRNNHYFWPFNDVKFGRGYVNVVDGKAYTSATRDGEYKEITW